MGDPHSQIPQPETVNLLQRFSRQMDHPELYRWSRDLLASEYDPDTDPSALRPVTDLKAVGSVSGWPTFLPRPIDEALAALDTIKDMTIGNDPNVSANPRANKGNYKMYDQGHIMGRIVALDREWAIAVQMQQAFLDVTRTHQETFFSPENPRVLEDSFREGTDVVIAHLLEDPPAGTL